MRPYQFLIPSLILLFSTCSTPEESFDEHTGQIPVTTNAQIDSVLSTLERIKYSELPEDYLEVSGNRGKFSKMVRSGTFYKIRRDDLFKYIVGTIRIQNFIPHDAYFKENAGGPNESYQQYWLVDKRILYKVLALQKELSQTGNDPEGFYLRCGHRHPALNESIGGASRSQHIAGKAVDITIKDINKDGQMNQMDKEIVLEILEDKIIKNEGGIGRYPGTMSVHFDVRGHRARWNSY